MLKIIYAADNRPSSFYSLQRFVDTYGKFYNIKTAAYTKSINNINVDWNLDALMDFRGFYDSILFNNSNIALYTREIKKFAPNLIISDMELYSSYIGIELGITVWQVSPLLLYYGGADDRGNIYKNYSALFSKNPAKNQYVAFVLNNSDKKLVLSHLCDVKNPPSLADHYQWVRPYYKLSDTNKLTTGIVESPAAAIPLADAYYDKKYSLPNINYADPESIITSEFNYKYGLSVKTNKDLTLPFDIIINPDVKFLSQYLIEMDI